MLNDGKNNFLAAHYDWLVAGCGLLALVAAAVFYVMAGSESPDDAAAASAAQVKRMRPKDVGVKEADLSVFSAAVRSLRTPATVAEVSDKKESFLASERRVKCVCGKAIPGDVKTTPECPYCHAKQEAEKVVVLDADQDGLPDEWEKKFGLNPNDAADADADKDKDGFTNAQEFKAKTDPTDPKDHPDYLDYVQVVVPLKETYLPFVFRKANQIPKGWRLEFFDPKRKDDYGRLGATLTAVVGEEIGDTGYVAKSYTPKSVKQAIAGTDGLTRSVDVSEVIVTRKRDGKDVTLILQQGKKPKFAAVDIQATLNFTLNGAKSFVTVPGTEITLHGTVYKVVEIKAVGKGAQVILEETLTGKRRTISALE